MIAQVIINRNAKKLDRLFDYNIPVDMENKIKIGSRVLVQFGNSKSLEEAFVISIKEKSEYRVKNIEKVEEQTYLDIKKVNMAKWIAKRYFSNISDAINLLLPPGTTNRIVSNRVKDKLESYVFLNIDIDELISKLENNEIKSDKQKRVLQFLIDNDNVSLSDLMLFTDVSRAIVNTLIKKGYLVIEKKEIYRNPFKNKNITPDKSLELTKEQENAKKSIEKSIKEKKYQEFLLFGITGSGKTEIYLQLIEKMINENKSSIVLVPEISLTPQMIDRFIARFGEDPIAVLHSKLSIGERYDEWKKIKEGKAKIVIGARSAIFAPVENLGLIIIDEEHDSSYKSEMNPRYDAKEVARYIAKDLNIPLVLGSATPDMISYYNAINGKIKLLELKNRANKSKLPDVEIVDLRRELANGNRSMISVQLYKEIEENIKNKRQTILFLNRRGYSTFVMCRDCGYTVKCRNCNITMTYHIKQNKMKCHYCGYESSALKKCPECNSDNIRYFGTGTQKLEMQINKMFPNASTIRMDIDTVTKKNSHEDILNKFREENIDILIGTQMIVKGHHFPNVTLVGVIAADSSLNIDDYRASERTFQILTQVAGRAGRGEFQGKVIIQTYNPDSFSIEYASKQDYKLFYNTEILFRKQLKYPPFCDIIIIGITSLNENLAPMVSNYIYNLLYKLNEESHLELAIYKPLPAPIDKIKNRYRWRIICKGNYNENINKILQNVLDDVRSKKVSSKDDLRINIEVNPNNMM